MNTPAAEHPNEKPRIAFVRRHAHRFWNARSNRYLVLLSSVWMFAISVPFLFLGKEGWGPIWYYLAQPFSDWLKAIYESGGVVAYVVAITVISALMALVTLFITWWTGVKTIHRVRRWRAKRKTARQ